MKRSRSTKIPEGLLNDIDKRGSRTFIVTRQILLFDRIFLVRNLEIEVKTNLPTFPAFSPRTSEHHHPLLSKTVCILLMLSRGVREYIEFFEKVYYRLGDEIPGGGFG